MGSEQHIQRRHFLELRQAVDYLREKDFRITGIEITPEARPITPHPFSGNTAFLPGNEGSGIVPQHRRFCDDFVYIPQFGAAASLNVNVATGIVLHQFSVLAGFEETGRAGEKFLLHPSGNV